MKQFKTIIKHAAGLHARPAVNFVNLAKKFESEIEVVNLTRDAEKKASAKSIVGLIKIACAKEQEIQVTLTGSDEEAAAAALLDFLEAGEEE